MTLSHQVLFGLGLETGVQQTSEMPGHGSRRHRLRTPRLPTAMLGYCP